MSRRLAAASLAVCLALLALGSCSSHKGKFDLRKGERYYLSLGDSYAVGFQPLRAPQGQASHVGFSQRVVLKAVSSGYKLRLVDFGCSGATTKSMTQTKGCGPNYRSDQGPTYSDHSQLEVAENFLHDHHGDVALITIEVGINDVNTCGVTLCSDAELGRIEQRLNTIVSGIRRAAGPSVRIIGLTYPDTNLAGYLSSHPAGQGLVQGSIGFFRDKFNPMLRRVYEKAHATFVDITAASGAYIPFTQTTRTDRYGRIPTAVARVCDLTFMCSMGDLHPTDAGYELIADQVVAALPRR